MKTVADYIKTLEESEGAVNTVSSGSIATKEVPLGKVQKRKTDESNAYEGENPLADAEGKFPLLSVQAPDQENDPNYLFHQKQQLQNNYS